MFAFAAIPYPFFDVAAILPAHLAIPSGGSCRRYLLYVLAGAMVKVTAVAYTCLIGIDWIGGLV